MKRKYSYIGMLVVAFLCCNAFACNQYHTAVVIEHDFQVSLSTAQSIEIAEFKAGNVDAKTHQSIQQLFLKIGAGGEQISSLMAQNASKQTVLTVVSQVAASVQQLQDTGALGIKNQASATTFNLLMQGIQATLANLKTFLGGAA